MTEGGSSVPRRQVGRLLKQAREAAGVPVETAVRTIEVGRNKLYRMENGEAPVRQIEAEKLCSLYQVSADLTEVIVALSGETKVKGWWHAYGDAVPAWFELYVGMEGAASRLRQFEPALIPGLLQTEAYAQAILSVDPNVGPEAWPKVRARLTRQRLLTRSAPPPPALEIFLDETVLLRPIHGSDEWCRQLAHLVNMSTKPGISVRILPRLAGLHLANESGAFVILDFPRLGPRPPEPTTVYSEGLTGALYLDKPQEVAAFERVWLELDRLALDRNASDDLISTIIKETV